MVQKTNPDGTYTTFAYSQALTTIVDPNGNHRIEQRDPYGRITKVTEFTSPTTSFDTNYQFDALGNLLQVTDAHGNKTSIIYDLLFRKVQMSDPDMGLWHYHYDYHVDHLGGLNIATDNSGKLVQTAFYYPYGETRVNTGTVDLHYKFTGQENDPETSLYYYGARYYDPLLARFISPDTIVQSPGDPQTLNRYSYCRNNPLALIDPNGHGFFSDLFGFFESFFEAFFAAFAGGVVSFFAGPVAGGMVAGAIMGAFRRTQATAGRYALYIHRLPGGGGTCDNLCKLRSFCVSKRNRYIRQRGPGGAGVRIDRHRYEFRRAAGEYDST